MSEEAHTADAARNRVLYEIPGMSDVDVRSGETYRTIEGRRLEMDIYRPIGSDDDRLAAILLVAGYPDAGYERVLGRKFKDTGASTSWARLIAASGLAAVTYTNDDPSTDARAVLRFMQGHAAALGIESSRIGLFAISGNVPLAAFLALWDARVEVACAALYYGYLPDPDGSRRVAEAAAQWRFTNPFDGAALESMSREVPLFVARAGRDEMPHLNDSIDRFIAAALARNLPITLVNHPDGPHAFDLFHDSETTRAIVRQTLTFFQDHLGSRSSAP